MELWRKRKLCSLYQSKRENKQTFQFPEKSDKMQAKCPFLAIYEISNCFYSWVKPRQQKLNTRAPDVDVQISKFVIKGYFNP